MTTDLIQTTDRDRMLEATKPCYRSEIRRFLDYAEVHGLTVESYAAYVADLTDQGKSAATVNKHIAAIRSLFRRLIDSPDLTAVQRWQAEKHSPR